MKKLMIFLMAVLSAMSMNMNAQALSRVDNRVQPSKIAVYVSGDADEDFADIIAVEFSNWISKVPCFQLYARDNGSLNSIVKEQNYQVSGNVSDAEIRKIGKQAGVDYIIDVSTRSVGKSVVMTARILNMESGKTIYSTKLQGKVDTPEEVLGLAGRCAHKVYQDFENRRTIE